VSLKEKVASIMYNVFSVNNYQYKMFCLDMNLLNFSKRKKINGKKRTL